MEVGRRPSIWKAKRANEPRCPHWAAVDDSAVIAGVEESRQSPSSYCSARWLTARLTKHAGAAMDMTTLPLWLRRK